MKKIAPLEQARIDLLRRERERKRKARARSSHARKKFSATYIETIQRAPNIRLAEDASIELALPQQFSFERNHADTQQAINQLRMAVLEARQKVTVDFRDVEYVGVAAALVLTSEIVRCLAIRTGDSKSVMGTYPQSPVANKILTDIGFYRALGVRPLESDEDNAPVADNLYIGMKSFLKADPDMISSFSEMFLAAFPHLDLVARQRLQGAIVEALSNSFEHAFQTRGDFRAFGRRAWLSGYVNTEKNEFMMMVFDHGAGIPRTIEPKLTERAWALLRGGLTPSDGDLISAATTLSRTSTDEPNRGKGFLTMKRFVDACDDGELRVFSNRGHYLYKKGNRSVAPDQNNSLGGTLIQWRITHHAGSIEVESDE